jgi:hypothetical protein
VFRALAAVLLAAGGADPGTPLELDLIDACRRSQQPAQAAAFLAPELTYAADTHLATALGQGLLDLPKWALPPDPHDTGEGDYGTP